MTIPGVRDVVAVASAKGGVGKSTVSANIALALARRGARVGLMDADIYGPSLPLIMGASGEPEMTPDGRMLPIVKHGVPIISMVVCTLACDAIGAKKRSACASTAALPASIPVPAF